MKKGVVLSAVILIVSLLLTACSANQPIDNTENNSTSVIVPAESEVPNETEKSPEKTGVIAEQILNGNDGTDWHETSARQAIELTEYFIENFSVDKSRVYAAGYSAGGETMSQAVSMRPDLYAAYLHGASQWDGAYESIAQNDVAIYIFMAENDEYYGSAKARSAYEGLQRAWRELEVQQFRKRGYKHEKENGNDGMQYG